MHCIETKTVTVKKLSNSPSIAESAFAEAPAWRSVPEGWRPLFGNFQELGFSFEWHDFQCEETLNWAKSFHPGSIELCLNLTGDACLDDRQQKCELGNLSLAFYHASDPPLTASRASGERHQFITVEYAGKFLAKYFIEQVNELHPLVRAVIQGERSASRVVPVPRAGVELTHVVESLRRPPVFAPAQKPWFVSKAIELASLYCFEPAEGELLYENQTFWPGTSSPGPGNSSSESSGASEFRGTGSAGGQQLLLSEPFIFAGSGLHHSAVSASDQTRKSRGTDSHGPMQRNGGCVPGWLQ